MAGEISDAVKKCVLILKNARDDTEKFAALFMVTKLVKKKDCSSAAKKAVFEAIGFDYIKRLLLTDDVPVDCPPSMYKSIALSILTVFCNEEELITNPEMLVNIPVFLDIVQKADDEDLMNITEAYNCLKGIARFPVGQKALIDAGGVCKLSEIYTQGSFESDQALNILSVLIAKLGPGSFENPATYHALLNKVAFDFELDQDKRKFELCEVLNAFIYACPNKGANIPESENWPASLYKGLTDILQSKIGAQQRNPALILASSVLDLLGIEWVLSDEEKPKQFFLLLIQLAAIEVRMQLDGKSLKAATNQKNLITACFIILELSINYISTDQLDLEQKEKQTLYTGLKGAFTAIINLLLKVAADKNKPEGDEKWFVYATIRVVAAWLAQETSALRNQVYQLLPFILEVANESFQANKARRIAQKSGIETEPTPANSVDILRILLPGLCHLTVEDPARAIILKVHEDKVLFELIQFHWTIVHYKRPPVPRSERLKVLSQPKVELSPETLSEMQDSRTAMISACNVLMNLTVLEAKYVEQSDVFNELLKFIFENLPELKDISDNLVLHGNMSVLGLLLLKQLSNKVKKNDFSICRYIQATIRFLWNAYTIDESSDPSGLVVAMTYKEYWMELMELWFLGMQTMSSVITQIPWISEFAIESGWAEGIIKILKKVKIGTLPPNVKSAYEDFLCHLVDANDTVIDVLKRAEALRVCRNHRLMELGKKLFGILWEKWAIPLDTANKACKNYLRAFRTCPENLTMSLDSWRRFLWSQALGDQYSKFSGEAYQTWLQLRYEFLALSPAIKSLLQKLREYYFLGLITNGTSRAQWEKIERLNLQGFFDVVLVSGDHPWEKPHRKIFQIAYNFLGVSNQQCIMVGDKLETDIMGGVEANLGGTVWVPLSHAEHSNEDPRPNYILNNVTDLLSLLPQNSKIPRFRTSTPRFSCPDLDDGNSNSSDGS